MSQEIEQKVTSLEGRVTKLTKMLENLLAEHFEAKAQIDHLERKLDAILAPQVAAYAYGTQFNEIKQALDRVMPDFEGKMSAHAIAQAAGLATDPAALVRIGRYLKSIGVKRGRNSNERYYWFTRQKNKSVISSDISVIDPFN